MSVEETVDNEAPRVTVRTIVSVQDFDKFLQEMVVLRDNAAKKKAELELLNIELEAMKARAAQFLKESNRKSYKSPCGTVTRVESWSFKNPQTLDDKKAFFTYLQEKEIFWQYATVNNQSLSSYCRAEMKSAQAEGRMDFLPPGIEAPTLRETLSVTEAKVAHAD